MLLGPSGRAVGAARAQRIAAAPRSANYGQRWPSTRPSVPRVALLETEYQLAITEAELRWVQQITDELAGGSLTWSDEDFAGAEEAYLPDA